MEYRRTKTTVSKINYHFVFCPKYRRKIFKNKLVEWRFKELVKEKCEKLDLEIIALECDLDHCHLFLNSPPSLSPQEIMAKLKGYTSHQLRKEFKELASCSSLWTRSYFVSTAGDMSTDTIKRYVENQKKNSKRKEN